MRVNNFEIYVVHLIVVFFWIMLSGSQIAFNKNRLVDHTLHYITTKNNLKNSLVFTHIHINTSIMTIPMYNIIHNYT